MSWVSERHLVAAISNAGGFGVIACGSMEPDMLAAEIAATQALTARPFGVNLIHSPGEPAVEAATTELLLKRGVRLIEASAYLDLTLPVVRYRVSGLHRAADGRIVAFSRQAAGARDVIFAWGF